MFVLIGNTTIKTLPNLKHHIHTAFGNSKISQGQENLEALVAGIGQGNGAGRQTWAVVSTPLFKIMQMEGLAFVVNTFCTHHPTETSTQLHVAICVKKI